MRLSFLFLGRRATACQMQRNQNALLSVRRSLGTHKPSTPNTDSRSRVASPKTFPKTPEQSKESVHLTPCLVSEELTSASSPGSSRTLDYEIVFQSEQIETCEESGIQYMVFRRVQGANSSKCSSTNLSTSSVTSKTSLPASTYQQRDQHTIASSSGSKKSSREGSRDKRYFARAVNDAGATTSDYDQQEIIITLTFNQAVRGFQNLVKLPVKVTCSNCKGTKYSYGQCVKCKLNKSNSLVLRKPAASAVPTCPHCSNKRGPCQVCAGKGHLKHIRQVVLDVPAGVKDGQHLQYAIGETMVMVKVRVLHSPYMRRSGSDVHSHVTISPSQAVLGGTVKVPGVYQSLTVDIPAGTSSHEVIKLEGKGIKKFDSEEYGDHYLHIHIRVPRKMDSRQTAIIKAFSKLSTDQRKQEGQSTSKELDKVDNDIKSALKEDNKDK